MALENAAQYRAWARRRNALIAQRGRQAMELSMDQIAQAARSTEFTEGTYDDDTGNLRASTGALVRIATPPRRRKLNIAQASPSEMVATVPGKIVGILGIGMEYAPHVAERGPWPENVVPYGQKVVAENHLGAMTLAYREAGLTA